MKTIITMTLLSLSVASFAGSVGESSTECFKNQSTQSRGAKTVVSNDTAEAEKEKQTSTVSE